MRAEFPASLTPSTELIDIPELVRTIGRYKWGIIGITLLAGAIAALVAFSVRPTYRGTVTLLIELRPQRVVQVQEVYDPGTGLSEYYWTQSLVLKSRELAARAVDRLQLVDHPEFAEPAASESSWAKKLDIRRFLPLPSAYDTTVADDPSELRNRVIDAVMGKLTVEPVGYTQIIKVHFDAHDPALAASVANALAELYIESGLEAKLEATQKANLWLVDKLGDIQAKLAQSEAALQAFLESERLVNVGGARTLTEEELVDYSRRLREAQKKRADYQAVYEKIRVMGNDRRRLRDIGQLLIDPLVERASQNYLAAQEVVKQLEERYGSRHPQMAAARARLEAAEAAYTEQVWVAAQGIKTEYELAVQSERELQALVNAARGQIQRLDRKNYQLSQLEREVAANRALYDTFLTRFKETDTTSSYESLIARIIDPAVPPREAHAPNKKKWVLVGTASGFLLSLVLALLHFALSDGIRTAEELEGLAQLPVFGVLPLVTGLVGKKKNIPMLFLEKPRTPLAEGIRSIRAALKLNDTDAPIKRLMVTSAIPAEGKSSVCAALALSLANERVLIVETDLRKPSLRRQFNLPRDLPGLTDLLSGQAQLEDCLFEHMAGHVTILHAGGVPPNPAELLSSAALGALLTELDARYDRILLDSPPCQAAADALVLARLVGGVLFVVKSESTARRAVKNSLKQLRYVGAPLTGLVVNQVDTRRNASYAQGYYYAYNYYQ